MYHLQQCCKTHFSKELHCVERCSSMKLFKFFTARQLLLKIGKTSVKFMLFNIVLKFHSTHLLIVITLANAVSTKLVQPLVPISLYQFNRQSLSTTTTTLSVSTTKFSLLHKKFTTFAVCWIRTTNTRLRLMFVILIQHCRSHFYLQF